MMQSKPLHEDNKQLCDIIELVYEQTGSNDWALGTPESTLIVSEVYEW